MYETFYGFSESPFTVNPDPRFLYMTPGHFEAYSSMLSGIKERKGVTVITGEVGVGKTTLIHSLLKDLDNRIKTSFVFFSAMTFPQLLKKVLADLNQSIHDPDLYGLLQTFHLYLADRLANNEIVAIVIDEAHGVQVDVLQDVARLVSRPNPSSDILKILLVGQPEFEAKLSGDELKGLRDVVSLHRRISTLSAAESEAYIDHRLKVVGSRSDAIFTRDAVERICTFANGIPRVINLVCDTALINGFARQAQRIDGKAIKEVTKDLAYLAVNPPRGQRRNAASPPLVSPAGGKTKYRSVAVAALALVMLFSFLWVTFMQKAAPVRNKDQVVKAQNQEERTSMVEEMEAEARPVPIETAEKRSTLFSLTKKHYGQTSRAILDMVLEANPSITDINLIYVNQKIVMPWLSEMSFVLPGPNNLYWVHLGTFANKPPRGLFEDEAALKGKTIQVVPRKVSAHETWYRVLSGPFTTRKEGSDFLKALRAKGFQFQFSPSDE
ncbi:MAG TPA: hypothetical protein DCR97_05455 [Deltaproteobacteria bacterium]|nr:hypothetical protein [Deltaproteobacteria bacterium]